ncbi:UNVERIFIED_CONTAM: hypothetical protein GTU68_031021 [Idotea baltica]|nr:hypothetical protein [Idotea baltica]
MRKYVIAVDGYAATGKSTTAKLVADFLGYTFIDTGAMYRAVTYYMQQRNIAISAENPEFQEALKDVVIDFRPDPECGDLVLFMNGINVDMPIRSMEVNAEVSEVAAISEVRRRLVALQREMGKGGGVVMDGRDIGTVVFPQADLKFFLIADMEVRVVRRIAQLAKKGKVAHPDEVRENLAHRDHIDSSREDSPLRKAADAVEIDTSDMTIPMQTELIVKMVKELDRQEA